MTSSHVESNDAFSVVADHAAEHGNGTATDFTRMIDLKGIAKPVPFTGTEEEWNDWKFRFLSVCSMLGLRQCMEQAAQMADLDESSLSADVKVKSAFLYDLLAQLMHGRAYAL